MKIKLVIKVVLFILIFTISFIPINASVDPRFEKKCTDTLVKLGLMHGYNDGTLKLDQKIKRSEYITLVLNVACIEDIDNMNNTGISFRDINSGHWAFENIKTACIRGIISGYPDNTIAPDEVITYSESLLAIIRVLGYKQKLPGIWPENVLEKATELGLCKNMNIPAGKEITRGEAAVIIFNALTVDINGV